MSRRTLALAIVLATAGALLLWKPGSDSGARVPPALAAGAFTEGFDGAPGAPLPFNSSRWEVTFASEWGVPADRANVTSHLAQHGPGCEPPGPDGSVTHVAPLIADLVFQCANHLMTHVPNADYAVIYLTPDQMVDLSGGSATIRFDVSTLSHSTRDWIDVWVQAWDTQEQRILDEEIPTAQGNPRNAVHIEQGASADGFESGSGTFHVEVFNAARSRVAAIGPSGPGWGTVLAPSAMVRSTVEIVLSRTHIKVWMPQHGLVWVDSEIPPLGFSQGIVSFGHHSYSPDKGEHALTGAVGQPNTWHWDQVSIEPAVPFQIINTDHRAALWDEPQARRTFVFDRPAPANAYLRFGAFGDAVRVSFGGAPVTATRTGPSRLREQPTSYLASVPAGATRATFEVTPAYGFVGSVENPTVFALGASPSGATPPPASALPSGGGGAVPAGSSPAAAAVLGVLPARGGIGLLVVTSPTGGSELVLALTSSGCPVNVIAVLEDGRWRVLIPGAPAAVNASFPAQLGANTPFFLRCAG